MYFIRTARPVYLAAYHLCLLVTLLLVVTVHSHRKEGGNRMFMWHWYWSAFHVLSPRFTVLVATLYFLPALIAAIRRAQHGLAIGLLNLFLGWTVIGWFAALIWAVAEQPRPLSGK